ncbi:MAG: FAD-binding oxidoreductase, partial [Gammaproteobacteria bacterium PRO9]|nr:FAD-binding oxidoreductase [Gammaproteobacteria bacterium PRO9]
MNTRAVRIPPADLVKRLRDCLGDDRVITDTADRELFSGDLYAQGALATAVIRPVDAITLASAARQISAAGYALIPRGGGLSYTEGGCPASESSVVIDTTGLSGLVDFDPGNMTVTVG